MALRPFWQNTLMSSYHYDAMSTNQSDQVIPRGPEWTKADNEKRQQQMEAYLKSRRIKTPTP